MWEQIVHQIKCTIYTPVPLHLFKSPLSISLDVHCLHYVNTDYRVTLHPDNTHLRLNLNLRRTARHAVQCKMAVWQQCPR
jgi:hypothetical protein